MVKVAAATVAARATTEAGLAAEMEGVRKVSPRKKARVGQR
jgi:hypothetical protein